MNIETRPLPTIDDIVNKGTGICNGRFPNSTTYVEMWEYDDFVYMIEMLPDGKNNVYLIGPKR